MSQTTAPGRALPRHGAAPATRADAEALDEAGGVETEPEAPGERTVRIFNRCGLGVVTAVVLCMMQPWLLVLPNTPTGGDMGAHVYIAAYMRDHLLPNLRLAGWSHGWYAGLPMLQFYFPLAPLAIVAGDVFLPYGVAFKLVTVAGVVALPACCYVFARLLDLEDPAPLLAAIFAVPFLFYEGFKIYGGNIPSTLAGEFSFSWSFGLSLLFLGTLVRMLRRQELRILPALLFGLVLLTHLVTAIVCICVAFVLLFQRGFFRSLRSLAFTGVLGVAFAAIWFLPLVTTVVYTTDMGWSPEKEWSVPFAGVETTYEGGNDPSEFAPFLLLGALGMLVPLASVAARAAGGGVGRWVLGIAIFGALGLAASDGLRFVFVDMFNTTPVEEWRASGLHTGLAHVVPGVLLLASCFFVPSVVKHKAGPALLFPLVGLGLFLFLPEGLTWLYEHTGPVGAALEERLSASKVLNARFIPYWFWGVMFFAGLAVAEGCRVIARRLPRDGMEWGRIWLPGTAAVLVSMSVYMGIGYIDGWTRWNYEGYEAKSAVGAPDNEVVAFSGQTAWTEYSQLMQTMTALGPGRVQWEANSDPADGMNRYGTPMALMLFPYWTQEKNPSMEGLLFESGFTTPFHFLNTAEVSQRPSNPVRGLPYPSFDLERGLDHLRYFNIRYYVTYTRAAREAARLRTDVVEVATVDPFSVFLLGDTGYVTPVAYMPAVYDGPEAWVKPEDGPNDGIAVAWYTGDPANLDYPIVESGPAEWRRFSDLAELPADAEPTLATPEDVSEVVITDDSISFHTEAVGVPHLVRVSYFPNWEADGADGPYVAGPTFMLVVPTQEDVTLTYGRTTTEWVGIAATGVAFLLLLTWRWTRRPLERVIVGKRARHVPKTESERQEEGGEA